MVIHICTACQSNMMISPNSNQTKKETPEEIEVGTIFLVVAVLLLLLLLFSNRAEGVA